MGKYDVRLEVVSTVVKTVVADSENEAMLNAIDCVEDEYEGLVGERDYTVTEVRDG